MPVPQRRVRLLISGRVQGVSFRAYTMREAASLDLTGWVRNLPTGQVEIIAQGDLQAVNQLIVWAHRGPLLARVDRVEVEDQPPASEFSTFSIR